MTLYDGATWHMFYVGTPNTSPAPDRIPAFPYMTLKALRFAHGTVEQAARVPFRPRPDSYYTVTASPGHIAGDTASEQRGLRQQRFGVLKLTLHPSSYDWQFIPIAGATFTDSDTTTCH